jgi:hypothetical protein
MLPEFLGNYVKGRRQFIEVRVDRRLSLVFFPDKKAALILCYGFVLHFYLAFHFLKLRKSKNHQIGNCQ